MTYLLELAFGPVQSFIASARRSRDLWAGSFILSEIVRAAGLALLQLNARLIYPIADRVMRTNPDENSNLSNVILAMLPDGVAPERAADAAIGAGKAWLAHQSDTIMQTWLRAGVAVRQTLWVRQVEDAIEAYAAWSALADADYRLAYERLKAAFAARKNTRDFVPFCLPQPELGWLPKNSFDGLRESVLPESIGERQRRRFGLSANEQLDALGAIKRELGRQERFVPLTRIAAHEWLKSLPTQARQSLAAAYEPLVALDLASRVRAAPYGDFPYDAALVFPSRLSVEKAAAQNDAQAAAALDGLAGVLAPLWKQHGAPNPYVAMVVADGDRMGAFVDKACSADEHSAISAAVASFADQVPHIARQYDGQCVFNGGEDLTVLLPLSAVLDASRALAAAFEQAMAGIVQRLLGPAHADQRPTLRVGVAICHVLEPMSVIRQWANAAEKLAKGDEGSSRQGNALGLVLHLRAGHEIALRIRFDDAAGFAQLQTWLATYAQNQLTSRLAYDTRAIALDCEARGLGADVAEGEFRRLLDRARERGGGALLASAYREQLVARAHALRDPCSDPTGYRQLANELIVARWLSARTATELGWRA